VETDYFSIYPVFSYNGDEQKLRGYRVVHMLRAKVDVERAGEIIDLAVLSGANQVSGISFTSSKIEEAKKEVLREAVRDAQEKARVIAEAAGVQILGIKEITYSSASIVPPYARYETISGGTPITPAELRVSASVTLSYWIA
ncbi:MAG: SIMPL domain-containing protein, partial [Archaeoglobi archaeon]|nr:SIMPL domain-containing protein [Candidatus Mnemosynella bozhongmuii]